MGKYYNPPEDVVAGRVGRILDNLGDDYESYAAQLASDEYLYLSTYNEAFWVVVFIDSPAEFDRTYGCPEGKTGLAFYALPEAAHQQAG